MSFFSSDPNTFEIKKTFFFNNFVFIFFPPSVGKQSPCMLSFVYTSYIRYGVRAAPMFGKHALLFSYHKEQKYIYSIICSVILLSFSNMCFLENIC